MILLCRIVASRVSLVSKRSLGSQLRQIVGVHTCSRLRQQQKTEDEYSNKAESVIAESKQEHQSVSTAIKAKEAIGNVSYGVVFLLGAGILLGLFYVVGYELFSQSSVTKIQDKAFQVLKDDARVQRIVGTPIACYGTESSSRRGRHQPRHYVDLRPDGTATMRMSFIISGPLGKANVMVQVEDYKKENVISRIHIKEDKKFAEIIRIV